MIAWRVEMLDAGCWMLDAARSWPFTTEARRCAADVNVLVAFGSSTMGRERSIETRRRKDHRKVHRIN